MQFITRESYFWKFLGCKGKQPEKFEYSSVPCKDTPRYLHPGGSSGMSDRESLLCQDPWGAWRLLCSAPVVVDAVEGIGLSIPHCARLWVRPPRQVLGKRLWSVVAFQTHPYPTRPTSHSHLINPKVFSSFSFTYCSFKKMNSMCFSFQL